MRQTRVNIRSFFKPSFTQLPMLYSDSLLRFCTLLAFKHAEFLLRPSGLYPGNICWSLQIFRASHLRSGSGYYHNEIIVLIIGKTKTLTIKLQKIGQCFAVFFKGRLPTHSEISSPTCQMTKQFHGTNQRSRNPPFSRKTQWNNSGIKF